MSSEKESTAKGAVSVYLLHPGPFWKATGRFLHLAVGLSKTDAFCVARYTPSTIASLTDQTTAQRLQQALDKLGAIVTVRSFGEDFPTDRRILTVQLDKRTTWLYCLFILAFGVLWLTAEFKWAVFDPLRKLSVSLPVSSLVAILWPLLCLTFARLSITYMGRCYLRQAMEAWQNGQRGGS